MFGAVAALGLWMRSRYLKSVWRSRRWDLHARRSPLFQLFVSALHAVFPFNPIYSDLTCLSNYVQL